SSNGSPTFTTIRRSTSIVATQRRSIATAARRQLLWLFAHRERSWRSRPRLCSGPGKNRTARRSAGHLGPANQSVTGQRDSTIRLVRLPPPLTLQASGSRERGRQRLGLADDELMFLFAFDFHSHIERKNPAAAIQAFRRAFSPSDSARLVLKCVNGDSNREGF